MRKKITTLLKTLHFGGMAKALERILDDAQKEGLPIEEVLYKLLQEEFAHRQERSMA